MSLKDLIEANVKAIVDDTENIRVTEEVTPTGFKYEVAVAKDDVGRLIGVEGRNAKALRTILRAAASKENVRVVFNILKTPIE